jgi:hypothetical protein
MNKTFKIVFCFTVALIVYGCAQFPNQYERVDAGMVRCLDFVYEPAEAAPGDTVTVKAIFAGDSTDASQITWSISTDVYTNDFGVTAAFDTVPLTVENLAYTFSDSTSAVAFRFVVPNDVIAKSSQIPEGWTTIVPEQFVSYIPQPLLSLSKTDILSLVDGLSVAAASGSLSASTVDPGLAELLPAMLQLLTVQIRLYAKIEGSRTILSSYTVRYNSRFDLVDGLGVGINTNPVIDSIGVYKIKSPFITFYDSSVAAKYETQFTRIFGPDDRGILNRATDSITTIEIDAGCSYFIAAFTSSIDTVITMDIATGGAPDTSDTTPIVEQHMCQWYFQLDETEVADVSPFDFPNISGLTGLAYSLFPSLDERVVSATVWCEINDMALNEAFRPQGSALKEIRLRFSYTDAYKAQINKSKE